MAAEGVWQSPAFIGMFGDPYLRNTPYEAGGDPRALIGTLAAFTELLQPASPSSTGVSQARDADGITFPFSGEQEVFLQQKLLPQLARCQQWAEKGMKVGDAKQLQAFLQEWKQELQTMEVGVPMLIPGGFISNVASHTIIYIVEKQPDDTYTFTVCNKGPGAELYHPSKILTESANACDKIRVQSCLQIHAIPSHRFMDMAFWTLLFSLWVRKPPSEYHRVETIYDVLLPWLAGDQLLPLACEEPEHSPEWTNAGLGGAHTSQRSNLGFCKSVIEAIRYLCLRNGVFTTSEIKFSILYKLRYQLSQQMVRDLEIANNPALGVANGTLDMTLRTLSSISLLDSLQGSHNVASLPPDAVIGIYFARSTCAPCRQFTKTLISFSEHLRAANKKLVLIVVSVDQEQAAYTTLVADLPSHTWLMVPFAEIEVRKQLVQTFQVTSIPVLIFRHPNGTILTPKGRELVQTDPSGEFYPWTNNDFVLPKGSVSASDRKLISMGVKQLGLKTLTHFEHKNINSIGLRYVNGLMDKAEQLVMEIEKVTARTNTDLLSANFKEKFSFTAHANAELLRTEGEEGAYAGSTADMEVPILGNFLDVPERVTSIPLAVAAFMRCASLCESLLRRAAEGSSSSRVSLHHEIIQLITGLFVEVLPVPLPPSKDGTPTSCMWCQPVSKDMQVRCLNHIYSLLMILGCVWQSIEQPTRQFDSERSLAALCALASYDALLRTPANDEPLEISKMMGEEGGYVLGHKFCKANFSLQKVTSSMEFARPNFGVTRGLVLAYFDSQDAKCKHQLFEYHMPDDKIEVKKYSTTLLFFRQLMERYQYQLVDVNNPNPPTEMEALMEWFCGEDSPMASDHPEVAMTRDLVMAVKFLVTMETKEVELMRRRVPHQHWQMWQLSFDDTSSSRRRNFFGMRGLNRILNATFKWEVTNFRGSDQDVADVDVEGFMERKIYFGEGPVVSSPAELTTLLVSSAGSSASATSLPTLVTEDDIMHLTELPTFNATLSLEESEYLMSYLTVPYARIPLITSFFSSRDRVTYLFNPMLQNLLRAVLFESGDWVRDDKIEEIAHIPLRKSTLLLREEAIERALDGRVRHQKSEDHLGTVNGLLLNELVYAADAVLLPLLKMLDAVKELGEASVHSADAKFILFMIKLGIDVLRYLTFAIDSKLYFTDRADAWKLESYRDRLLSYLFDFAYGTLQKWRAEAEETNNLQTGCVIHSYLVLLHISLRTSEYSVQRVSDMIGSIAYVRNWHCFGMKLSAENSNDKDGLSAEERLLRWLQAQGINTENIAKSSLDKYLKGRPLYLKIGMQTIQAPSIVALHNEEGKEVQLPPGEVLEAELFETIHLHRRAIVKWLSGLTTGDRSQVLGGIVRIALRSSEPNSTWNWSEGSSVGSAGRYSCSKTELKLDTQTGEILWRNDELKPVPDSMTQFSDFKGIFGNRSLHCGLVSRQEHRLWVNIVGTDFQLIEWDDPIDGMDQGVGAPVIYTPSTETNINVDTASEELKMYWECPACTCANFNGDNPNATCDVCGTPRITRPPPPPPGSAGKKPQDGPDGFIYLGKVFSRPLDIYSEEDHPHSEEQWVVNLVGNVLLLLYPPDPEDKKLPFTYFLPSDVLRANANRVQLIGYDQGPKEKREKEKIDTFKEIIAYRTQKVVHIYALVTHGRRMYRKLIFTSNSRLSLHSFPLNISPDDGPVDPALLRAGGDSRERQLNGGSLVILRKNNKLNGTEQYVPPRLLQGVIPSCLLEAFRFWMGEDGKLRGEPIDVKSQWFRYRVEVEIAPDGSALICRKSIKTSFSRIITAGSNRRLQPPPAPVTIPASTMDTQNSALHAAPDTMKIQDEDVVQLMAMGFSYAACTLSLRENRNNVTFAAQWLIDESNQAKISQAEEVAQTDVVMSEEEIQEQNIAMLMSLPTAPSRVAVEYALNLFKNDVDLSSAWLSDAGNREEIKRVEGTAAGIDSTSNESPAPMEVDFEEKKEDFEDEAMEVVEEVSGETLYLLNLLNVVPEHGDEALAMSKLLCRVEDLSHVLVWCLRKSDTTDLSPVNLSTVAFVELPRLKLKLKPAKGGHSGTIRFDIMDENGWFISDLTMGITEGVSKYLQSLLRITPDCLVIESDTRDLKLITPNHDVYRPLIQGEPFASQLVSDRASVGWQQAMETRYYMYPIHSSHTFVLPPSLSSTLYLILTSLLTRHYTVAMELIVGCNVDVKFTDEEKWIFDQLSKTLDDRHPNACACRIRLSLGIVYSDNKAPWQLRVELQDYIATVGHVDAACKLTLEEEKEALANCHQRSSLLSLRKAYCDHVMNDKSSQFEFKLTRNRVGGQPWMKLRLFGKDYMASHAKKLSTVRYNRPKHSMGINNAFLIDEEEIGKLVWNCAVVGDEISGSNRGLGFLFLYECLNNQLVVRLGGDDCTRSFGDLFTRFLHLKLSRWGRETVEEGEEEYAPSYALAQLAMIAAHPTDAWSSSPCDQESTRMLSHGANLYSKITYGTLLKSFFDFAEVEFQSKLQSAEHQNRVVTPIKAQFSHVHESAQSIVDLAVIPVNQDASFNASNASCEVRTFSSGDGINPEFPLDTMDVKRYIIFSDPEVKVDSKLPFNLSQHPAAQTVAAKDLLKRLEEDINANAAAVNESKDAFFARVTPKDLLSVDSSAIDGLHQLVRTCEDFRAQDRSMVKDWIQTIEAAANQIREAHNPTEEATACQFMIRRRIGLYPQVTFDFLTSLLASSSFEDDLKTRNPFLKIGIVPDLIQQILTVLFLCNRIVHTNRTIQAARVLSSHLTALYSVSTPQSDRSSQVKQARQASKDLADVLLSKRHYLHQSDGGMWQFDPRFLVFEYVFDLLLRGRQVQMINSFLDSLGKGESRVQQMIMGAGKTTVVGPLLTYILADKKHLVTHVMPTALLEQSRQVLRSRFSNLVLRKRIFTFEFDRSVSDDPNNAIKLFAKLNRARLHGDVVCASPESIKSMMLKLVELLHSLEESSEVIQLPLSSSSQNVRRLRRILEDRSEMADELYKTIRLWQEGILIMDEVDVLLHPLRSELNFPIGNKFPIDLAANRWELPIHLIDAVLAHKGPNEKSSLVWIQRLQIVLDEGYKSHALQRFPHLVLLDMEFYEAKMMPILTELALEWLMKHFWMGKMEVDADTIKYYLQCPRVDLHSNESLRKKIEEGLTDSSIKLLNLARDWLCTILPHVLSKINRVSYGLLRGEHQAAAASGSSGGNSQSRLLLAVPFIGKDVPSRSSEFAHPDVLIGLTILAYRYEGIRVSDLIRIVSQLKQDFSRQLGPRDQRPAAAMFREWVASGLAATDLGKQNGGGVLPLPLFQLRDSSQVARLHTLIANLAGVVYYYVRQHVFPSCMIFQKLKISACGHELGSNSLFAKRIGFSGTPSNLLPMDLGECYYEPRSDGSIFQALTNPRIVSIERKVNWSAKSLLLDIAKADPPFHALIDTGALITGFQNQEVAAFLLAHMPVSMEGVVYLDNEDRQMILLRDHNAPMPLVQCGLHPSKRFTFYDQVHTTGMDIKQCVNARAVLTLGKDMTFRDYAQGAYRMRGIATGQSIHLYMIPEVENRIRHEMQLSQSNELVDRTKQLTAFLLLVPAWLLINSMRMESMQLVQLSLQELHNTWRKRALNSLMHDIGVANDAKDKYSQVARLRRFVGTEEEKAWLRQCINRFRVEISYTVDAVVPTKKELKDVIEALVAQNEHFLQTQEELKRIEDVKQRLAHSSSHHLAEDGSEQGDMRLTAEVVHENEAEAEEEAEEEAEQEEQKMSAFTRDDEHPILWDAMVLTQSPDLSTKRAEEDGVFYPFSQFQAHTECPNIAFPSQLLVSGNYFRRRWVGLGERRVKNVGLILEWSPLLQQEAMKKTVHHLFMEVMAQQPGITPNEAAVLALSRAAELPNLPPTKVPPALKAEVLEMIEQMPVFMVALSLAEGETIRRMIHKQHPAFKVSQVQLRTCEGELVESSSFYSSWMNEASAPVSTITCTRDKTVAIGTQCLRFFNNEMYYFPQELELLLEGLAKVPIALRHEFFECLLRLRRRERHLWGDTPLAKVFTKKDEWHLLAARARMQQFQQSLMRKKKNLHLAPALRRFDENGDGRLSAEEILKCFESFQLGYSSGELTEIISLIADVSLFEGNGGVPMETICAAFGISKQQMEDALQIEDAKMAQGLEASTSTWSCPVCTFVNAGDVDTCGACNELNPLRHPEETAASQQGWRCGNCTFINQPSDTVCAICELGMDGQRQVPRGKWICAGEQGGCTFFNSMANFYCEVCNRARPDLSSTRF